MFPQRVQTFIVTGSGSQEAAPTDDNARFATGEQRDSVLPIKSHARFAFIINSNMKAAQEDTHELAITLCVHIISCIVSSQ